MSAAEQSLLQISIEQLLEGVQIIGFDWKYLYLNETAARHGGQPRETLVGKTMMSAYPGIERTELFEVLKRVMSGRRSERMVNEFAYPSGERRWFELLIEPVPDGICVLSVDVTARREAELKLQQAQKMEAIGQLAGGLAHDFNNMLTAILGYAELISGQIGPDKPIGRDLQEIVVAGQRAAALTRQLLTFVRRQTPKPAALSLNTVVETLEPMLRRLISENISIRLSMDPATHGVWGDSSQIEQILMNLVLNARDAMPDGGTVTISTRNASLDEEYICHHPDAKPGEYAVLGVADDGVGMTPDVRDRAFDPFFTTKGQHGTGLGLAVVRDVVNQLGGHVLVYSEAGHGAVFKIYLPKTDQAVPSARPARQQVSSPVGHETVLVVEDETALRSFACTVLRRHGYHVLEAASAELALALAASRPGAVDLLLTDVVLPGIDGTQLARRIRFDGSAPRVLFMSGYAEPVGPALPFEAVLLEKPFTAHALLTRVREVLGDE